MRKKALQQTVSALDSLRASPEAICRALGFAPYRELDVMDTALLYIRAGGIRPLDDFLALLPESRRDVCRAVVVAFLEG